METTLKITDLENNECIHCETEEQAKAICKLMHEAGLKWTTGSSYLSKNNYGRYTSETCYLPSKGVFASLDYAKGEGYTIYKAEQFLTKKQEVMSTIVNINPGTSEINITPKEGFEIDLENSDLKNGKVLIKEAEKKYPSDFIFNQINGELEESYLSKKYAEKLDTLDKLLFLRDEYNRIDGFKEGFRFEIKNWSISNINNELDFDYFTIANKIMHFGKQETAKLFLKNFEEQLEQIKEFL